jgi:hypothetical protein
MFFNQMLHFKCLLHTFLPPMILQPTYLPIHPHTYLPIYPPIHLPIYILLIYLPTYILTTYLPTHPPRCTIYLFVYLPTHPIAMSYNIPT